MARYTHGVATPMTEDKQPVQTDIEQVATHGDKHRDKRVAESLKKLFAERKKEERNDRKDDQGIIRSCTFYYLRFLAKRIQKSDAGC